MRLIVRKALNFANHDDNNLLENIWDKFTKTSKIGPSMESLNDDFFNFLSEILNVLFWIGI